MRFTPKFSPDKRKEIYQYWVRNGCSLSELSKKFSPVNGRVYSLMSHIIEEEMEKINSRKRERELRELRIKRALDEIRKEEAEVIRLAEELSKIKGIIPSKQRKFRVDQNKVSQWLAI